jgi:hypothetical protein
MARIDIRSNGGAALNDGVLQLENGVAMDSTLRNVADQNNTTSPLKISTTAVQVVSPLRITTDDPSDMYLDCEDGSTNNRFNITRNTASQQVNLNFASNPAGSTTTVGAIRTFTDGVNLGEVVKFREDGQVTFTERVNIEADSLVTTESCSVIAATTTNANLVIAPNGTGALVASIPDGTVTGGNARGNYAVDLQTIIRTAATQVASGVGSFALGARCTASNTFAIAMGDTCTASNLSSIALGTSALSSGSYSVVIGGQGNTASSNLSTVSGGQSNTASTNTHATVVGGQSNTASGLHSVAGGQSNTASGTRSVALGESNTASNANCIAIGRLNVSNATYSVAIGNRNQATQTISYAFGSLGHAYLYGQNTFGNAISVLGDCQYSTLLPYRDAALTTGATALLFLDGSTLTIIPTGINRMWNVQVRWVAVVTAITGTATGVTVGDTKTSTDLLAVAKRSGTTTVSAHTSAGTHAIETIAGSLTAANITYSAGASQEMAITFTGPTFAGGGSVTMRVVAAVSLTEVAF